jgi:uncharacterized protein YlxW (UPF0749 family)
VTEATGSEQPARGAALVSSLFTTPTGWLVLLVFAVLVLACAIAGYEKGLLTADAEMKAANEQLRRLGEDNRRLAAETAGLKAKVADLQSKLARAQAELETIDPDSTHEIGSNQSKVVAGARLTIGLIGSPTIYSVNININGKQQVATAGDVVKIPVDQSTLCWVRIESFDANKVVVVTMCSDAKP